MNRRRFVVSAAVASAAAFGGGAVLYRRSQPEAVPLAAGGDQLVRFHSPVKGRADAPVTLVEFFDPSCEACRAFHPILNQIVERHGEDMRLVLRYTPLHEGSDEAVRILEAARRQNRFEQVLEALFSRQPEWADHGQPNLDQAWAIAGAAGLDLDRARQDARLPQVQAVLDQDMADMKAVGVERTPTFFLNGREPTPFGPQPLYQAIVAEIERTKASS